MVEIAELMKRVVIDKEDPKKVRKDVSSMKSKFQTVHYCFENSTKAYEYVKIR